MRKTILIILSIWMWGCTSKDTQTTTDTEKDSAVNAQSGATMQDEGKIIYNNEKHIKNVRQLTFGGDNAEAYFSFNDKMIVLQVTNSAWGTECDQIFYANLDDDLSKNIPQLISTGKGRTTCSYFLPGDTTIIFASTHLKHEKCPPTPERREDRYVWPIFPEYDIFVADLKGNIIKQLTTNPGYDAEATVSPKGDKIVFTSTRSGDIELYTMNIDGSNVKQITHELGYDGGAFFSPDGSKLVFRASRPKTEEDVKLYKDLLAENLVQPLEMEIFICNVDGSDLKQITALGKANWAPYFHPSGNKIIFSSNHKSEKFFPLNLFMINIDGTGLEQLTFDHFFDAFPMFSNDGKKFIFSSNRNNNHSRATNVFIADWVD